MSSTVPSNPFAGQLEEAVRDFLKEKLEFISNVLQVEHPEAVNRRNGSYERTWETRYGRIAFRCLGIERGYTRHRCLNRISVEKDGLKKRLFRCIGAA